MRASALNLLTVLAAAGLIGVSSTPAKALSGDFTTVGQIGSCSVRMRIYGGNSADVMLQVPGDPTAGGALFAGGKVVNFTAIRADSLTSCGLSNVTLQRQQGAAGAFATADYIGFAGTGIYKSMPISFELAIVGASNSKPVYKYEFNGPAGNAIAFKP